MALSDLGNCERFVLAHGSDVRHVQGTGEWFAWDGRRFAADSTVEVERLAKRTMRAILLEAEVQDNEEHRRQVIAHQIRSESERSIRAALSLAKSDEQIAARLADFDRNEMLLNVLNGTLDLRRGELLPHSRNDLLTKLAPVRFDPRATCPRWVQFLAEILPDPELVAYVQRAVGYSLTGDASEECIFVLFGTGANGKSKFLEVIRHVLGNYALASDMNTFLAGKAQAAVRNDVARLRCARFVTAVENEPSERLAESLLKICTGGDKIAARFLYNEHFEFVPVFKLWFATNHKPRITGTDDGIWRRMRLLPFGVTIPPERRDRKLVEKLKLEASGVLNWALAGLRGWQEQGLGEPSAVNVATSEYRTSQDVLANFLAERCCTGLGREAPAGRLYAVYKKWSDDNGEVPMKAGELKGALEVRGFRHKHREAGKFWLGISIADPLDSKEISEDG
jgi:putative DNA primase/helicase